MFDGKYFDWNQKRIKGIVDHFGYKFFYNKKVLDLGCGHADLSGVLYRLGAEITAVDARQEHLKIVSKKFPGIKTIKANLDGPWPFFGQKFDIILDLALLCHLSSFEEHLKIVCSSTNFLILETAVCDSADPEKCIQVPEGKEVYDLAYNGMGCRPTAQAIENILTKYGMGFKRADNNKYNSSDYVYDWHAKNDNSININKRRLWFASKDTPIVVHSIPGVQPVVMVQPQTHSIYAPASLNPINDPMVQTASPKPLQHWQGKPLTTSNYDNSLIQRTNEKFAISSDKSVPQFPHIKVLYLPLGHQPGMVDAFNNVGVKLDQFDFYGKWEQTHNKSIVSNEFLQKVRDLKPDLIHMQLQFTGLIDSHTLAEVKNIVPNVRLTNWSGDVRDTAIPNFVDVANAVDYSLISSTGQLDLYRRAGCKNIKYWQIGFDPKISFPLHKSQFKYDASFLGNNYGTIFPDSLLRVNAANVLRNTFGNRFGLFGAGYVPPALSVDPKQSNEVYNDSICPLSISHYNNISHYFSDRLLMCMASGRPTISWKFPGYEDYFIEDEEIFIANSVNDVIDIVKYCQSNPEAATKVGIKGHERILKEHTFTSRVLELLNITKLDGSTE